jgi:GH25 family lysozyme M1 (1,4-beta-N-acetylmuramidase)
MTIKGIDVSDHQPSTYGLAGFDFVVVKATEGTGYVNEKHAAQVGRGRRHGLVVGHYHFVRDGSMVAQADFFLKHAAPQRDEFLALDWEDPHVSSADKDAFLHRLRAKAGGRRVLLYCNVDYWLHRDTSSYAADGLWIAQYGVGAGRPHIRADWLMHQYTSSPVDTSVANFSSREALAKWAGAAVLPKVSLAAVVYAATHSAAQEEQHPGNADDVRHVQDALVAHGHLERGTFRPGIFDVPTEHAYSAWQKAYSAAHHLGWKGADVNGVPGMTSLKALGSGRFTATT